eukprot:gene6001-4306_t
MSCLVVGCIVRLNGKRMLRLSFIIIIIIIYLFIFWGDLNLDNAES